MYEKGHGQNEPYVLYGDFFVLSGSQNKHQFDHVSGVLSATGFVNCRIFFQTLPFNLISSESSPLEDSLPLVRNYRDFIFQIWPRLNYEAHKEYSKLLKDKFKYDEMRNSLNETDRAVAEEYELNLAKAQARSRQEFEANQGVMESYKGKTVSYGVEIQLMHADSGLFIDGKVTTSESDKSAYQFELSRDYNSGMIFRFLPKFQMCEEGDPVHYEAEILLQNIKLNCFVNFTRNPIIDVDVPTTSIEYFPPSPYKIIESRRIDASSSRYEAHLSQYQEISWKMLFHGRSGNKKQKEGKSTANCIMGGDLIRLRHIGVQGYIAADVAYQLDNPEVYVRSYHGEFPDENRSVCELWEVERMSLTNRGTEVVAGNTNLYKLRHFLTGRVLILDEVAMDDVRVIPLLAQDKDEKAVRDMENCLSFIPTVHQKQPHVVHGNSYALAFNNSKLFLQILPEATTPTNTSFNNYTARGQKKTQQQILSFRTTTRENFEFPSTQDPNPKELSSFFNPLKDSEFCIRRRPTYVDPKNSAEHAFYIEKVDESEKTDVLFVAATLTHLNHLRGIIKTQQTSMLVPDYLKKVIEILEQLIFFVVKVEEISADPLTCEGFTWSHRQRLLKDMRLIEVLTDILFYPFALEIYQLNNIPNELMVHIFRLSYKLIKHTIREYRPNELYASQWLDLFIHQSIFSDPNYDLFAELTLTELIDNNKRILENKIKPETINRFIRMLKTHPHEKFVNLLRALTVCDGEPMMRNQDAISRLIFEDEATRDQICYRIELRGESQVYVRVVPFNQSIDLASFEREAIKRGGNDAEVYRYFISMIYLLADLCLSRNYIAIDELKDIYTYDICFKIVSRRHFPLEIRTAFAKLFNHLWIDKTYQPVNLPNYLIMWEEITPENCNDLFQYNKEAFEFDSFKAFLLQYFEAISEQGYQKAFEEHANKMTFTLLENCQLLVSFGFYSTIKDLSKLLRPLLKILNGLKDVTTLQEDDKRKASKARDAIISPRGPLSQFPGGELEAKNFTSRYAESSETADLMRIKQKVLEIIEIVMKLFKDYQMRAFLLEFKKDQETQLIQRNKSNSSEEKGAQQWMEEIIANHNTDIENYSGVSFSLILIDLLLYENKELQKLAFQILYEQHMRLLNLKDALSQIYLVDEHDLINNIQHIRKLGNELQELADTTEKWYGKNDEAALAAHDQVLNTILGLADYLQIKHQKDLERVDEIVEDEEEEKMEEDKATVNIDADEVFECGALPNPEYQKIMRYMNIHQCVLEILNYDLKGRFEADEGSQESTKKSILKACVKFLARFVAQDKTNQEIVYKHSVLLMKMLKKDPSLGLENIIVELFYDNKSLLNDNSAVENYLHVVVKLVEYLPNRDVRRGKLLLTFNSLMKPRDGVLKKNQTLVIHSLSRKEYITLIPDFTIDRTWESLEEEFKNYHYQVQEGVLPVELSGELDYLVSLLDVMAVSCEEKNAATESKCQFFIPLKALRDIYVLANKCYYVKYAVMYFLYHVYLDTEKDLCGEDDQYLSDIFVSITEDLETILQSGWSSYKILTNKGLISSNRIEEVLVFEGFIPNLISLLSKDYIQTLPNYELILIHTLLRVKKFHLQPQESRRQRDVARLYQVLAKNHIEKIEEHSLQKELNLDDDSTATKCITRAATRTQTRNKMMLIKMSRGSASTENKPLSAESRPERFQGIIESLNDEEFEKSIEREFDSLIYKIVNIEKIAEEETVISYESAARALIELIVRDETPLDDEMKAIGIRIFRKIIEREVECGNPAAEWETKDWAAAEMAVVTRQNELTKFGAVEMVCKLLASNQTDRQIIEEAILLAIALLVGGNPAAQKAFLQFIRKDTNNHFLLAVKNLILATLEEVKKDMGKKNERYAKKYLFGEEEGGRAPLTHQETQRILMSELTLKIDIEEADNHLHVESKSNVDTLVKIFRLLQLFCEGHYLDMQNILRQQTVLDGSVNVKSVDFISYSAFCFNMYTKFSNADCLALGDQILEFLIEAVQGPCAENQKTLVLSKVINSCMDYATVFRKISEQHRRGFNNDEQMEDLAASINKALKLLYSLLEGNTDQSITSEMCTRIDFKYLIHKLSDDFASFCQRKGINLESKISSINESLKSKKDPFDDQILESFGVFILLRTLADKSKSVENMMKKGAEVTTTQRNALQFFKSNTVSVEIMFNGQLIKVYFPRYPATRFLSPSSKAHLMNEVKRDSQNEKVLGLLSSTEYLFDEMDHLSKLSRRFFRVSSERCTFFRDIATVIALLINLIILFTYYREFDDDPETGRNGTLKTSHYEIFGGETNSAMKVSQILTVLGVIQIVCVCFMIALWMLLRVPLLLKSKWRDLIGQETMRKSSAKNTEDNDEDLLRILSQRDSQLEGLKDLDTSQTMSLLLKYGPHCPAFNKDGKRSFGNLYTTFSFYWINAHFLLTNDVFQYLIFYLIISLLGLFGPKIVYALQLLDVISRFPNLKSVVRAVTLNGKQLLMTSMLGCIVVFIYALFGFWFLDDLYVDSSNNSERTCSSMIQCFVWTLDLGLRKNGGIGDVTADPSYDSHTRLRWWTNVVWELSFFIVVNIVFLNLILGIIIETFAALRSLKKKVDHDMFNKCYVCDLSRSKLDKEGKGFLHHIKHSHHLWNYMYFLYMLRNKDPLEYNGIESYVAANAAVQNVSWFPNRKALELSETKHDEGHEKGAYGH